MESFARRQLERPRLCRLRRRYRRQFAFLGRRLRPRRGLGLGLTMSLLALGVAGWLFGLAVVAVLASGKVSGVDQPLLEFFARHRSEELTVAVKAVSILGSSAFIVPAATVIGVLLGWRQRTRQPLLLLAGAYGGSALLYGVVKVLVARPRPPAALAVGHFSGWSFPSGHATQSVVFYGALAYILSSIVPSWSRKVILWSIAVVVALLVGLSRCYLGAHWASDVAGGWALGGLWLFTLVALTHTLSRPPDESPPPIEDGPVPGPARAADA